VECIVPRTHPSIQAGVDDPACTTVWVQPGTYLENVVIDHPLTVEATRAGSVTIDAADAGRGVDVTMGATVTLRGLTITGGAEATGAGIRASGELLLESCIVEENAATAAGAGIHGIGVITLVDTIVRNNAIIATDVDVQGGGVFAAGGVSMQSSEVIDNTIDLQLVSVPFGGAVGGGLWTTGPSELVGGSTVAGNVIDVVGVNGTGGGGGLAAGSIDLVIGPGTIIANNAIIASTAGEIGPAAAIGGGIAMTGGTISLTSTLITGNTLESSGTTGTSSGAGIQLALATLMLTDVMVTSNSATATSFAAGFATARGDGVDVDGELVVDTSTFDGNTAYASGGGPAVARGAGAYVDGPLLATDTTFSSNIAEAEAFGVASASAYGGGLATNDADGVTVELRRTTVSGNQAIATGDTSGGALSATAATMAPATTTVVLVDSTLSGNVASGPILALGGGIALRVNPGALGELHLASTTVTLNQSTTGGGVWLQSVGAAAFARNTIVQANTATMSPDCAAPMLTSSGYNLLGDATGCAIMGGPDLIGADAELQALAANGGPTQTHALTIGTAAVDGGDPTGCTDSGGVVLLVDQRGADRHVGAACDIGAFELP
jgi:hypothetical protein